MASILYRCNTCKREIALTENKLGLTVFAKCIITEGCKGTLYTLNRNPNILRQDLDFPPVVAGLNDYVERRAFFEKNINIKSNPWKIEHNLGVSPSVSVYFYDENTNQPYEVSPDDYTVTVVDKNNIEIGFNVQREGTVHLVSRSSVPREVVTVTESVDLFQVSNQGKMDFAVPIITEVSGDKINLADAQLGLKIEILIPSNPITTVEGDYLVDGQDSDSPWFGWDTILLNKRRAFSTKSLNILDVFSETFTEISSLSDIPDGTSFKIQQIKFVDVYQSIEPRLLMLLLSQEPYETPDKIRDHLVDTGELLLSTNNRFFVYDGEVFLDRSNIERTYPRIEEIALPTVDFTPTPTPSVTPTITFTPTQTPFPTDTPAPTPTPTPTRALSPTPTPTLPSVSGEVYLSSLLFPETRNVGAGVAFIDLTFKNNGALEYENTSGVAQRDSTEWWTGQPSVGIGASYQVRISYNTSLPSGVSYIGPALIDSWIDIDTEPSYRWEMSAASVSERVWYVTIYIRDANTLIVQETRICGIRLRVE